MKQKIGVLQADGEPTPNLTHCSLSPGHPETDLVLAHDRLAVLLAVNPRDEERRVVLEKEKVTIAKALAQLEALT